MLLASRPIAAFAVVGALSLLVAGCSAGNDDDPTASPTRSVSSSPSASATTSSSPSSDPSPSSSDDSGGETGGGADDSPSAFPGTGQTSQPDTAPSDYPATAVVTYSGWDAGSRTLQAGGLVSGTTDTAGTCTFAATKGGVTRTLTSTAEASASSVNCAQVSFPASQVSTGTWSITLDYRVGNRSTTSEPMTAEVP